MNLRPNGLRLSRLAGCALIGSVYNKRHRRHHARYHLAEGQVGSNRGLGVSVIVLEIPGRFFLPKIIF